ncbi:RabGAP/TBC [Ceraceosorus guamensis]|uniref:RabGAP/TBC n=1 Tax=Ceraceosorus guamensis TaxID=1522189 RepID=A0A316VX32_9BASI|nr:RabGAP/TBC [Ceraceosorus guamensis]PWN41003.1 RabGAP/TBC [Ceraceosorus guamensis]
MNSILAAYGNLSQPLDESVAPSAPSTPQGAQNSGRYLRWCDRLSVLPGASRLGTKECTDALRIKRADYLRRRNDAFRAPDGKLPPELTDEGEAVRRNDRIDASVSNPLGLEEDNPWLRHIASMSIMTQIQADVERTFPDEEIFQPKEVQSALSRILFTYCYQGGSGSETGYRQGMHELAAVCWLIRSTDSTEPQHQSSSEGDQNLQSSLTADVRSVECDTYSIFEGLMAKAGVWFEWKQDRPSTSTAGPMMPIMLECVAVHQTLNRLDPQLHAHLQSLGIEPQLYLLRWIRLLFTRELPLPDAINLWEALLNTDPTLKLAAFICIAMLLRIRRPLLESSYAEAFTHLLHFPKACLAARGQWASDTTDAAAASVQSRGLAPSLLVQQALALRDTGARGAVLCARQNEVILGLDVRTPDVAAATGSEPSQPRARQLPKTVATGRVAGHRPGLSSDSFARPSADQSPEQLNEAVPPASAGLIPDGIADLARGLYSRADALGVNRALVSAMGNVQRTVGAYAAVGAQFAGPGRIASTQDDGFPPSIDRVPRSAISAGISAASSSARAVRASRDPTTELSMLRASNAAMGQALSACIEVLERNWSNETDFTTSSTKAKEQELTGAQIEVLMSITALKHTRDVLMGTTAEFDPATVAWPDVPTSEAIKPSPKAAKAPLSSPQGATTSTSVATHSQEAPIEAIPSSERLPRAGSMGSVAVRDSRSAAVSSPVEPSSRNSNSNERSTDRSGLLNARAFARPQDEEGYNPLAGFRAAAENSRFGSAAFEEKESSTSRPRALSTSQSSAQTSARRPSAQPQPSFVPPTSGERRREVGALSPAREASAHKSGPGAMNEHEQSIYPPPASSPRCSTSPAAQTAQDSEMGRRSDMLRKSNPFAAARKQHVVFEEDSTPSVSGDPLGAS